MKEPSFELTTDGKVVALDRLGRFLLRTLGAERIIRWDARVTKWTSEPEGEDRCPWTTPIGRDQCAMRRGHGGVCGTKDYVNGRLRTKTWYGINYRITKTKGAPEP